MRNVLASLALLGLICATGSVAYYYTIFLPEQQEKSQEDINAIRRIVAPTPEQQKAQAEASAKSMAQMKAAFDAYSQCTADMMKKRDVWLTQQCKGDPNDPQGLLKEINCRSKALQSSAAHQFDCPSPH